MCDKYFTHNVWGANNWAHHGKIERQGSAAAIYKHAKLARSFQIHLPFYAIRLRYFEAHFLQEFNLLLL